MKQIVEVVDPNTVLILEGAWKSFVHILDTTILTHDHQIMQAVTSATKRAEEEGEERLEKTQKALDKWKGKLEA